MNSTTAMTARKTTSAVMTAAPWSSASWFEVARGRGRQYVDGRDDHPGALNVAPPHGPPRGEGGAVGRLGPPFLAVDAHQTQLAGARDVTQHDGALAEQPARADAGVVAGAVEAGGHPPGGGKRGPRPAPAKDPPRG